MNPWIVLIAAGLFEIGWPLGFKLAQTAPAWRAAAIALSVLSMAASGWLLFLAQKHIPIGTAYAVWTGIGAAGHPTGGSSSCSGCSPARSCWASRRRVVSTPKCDTESSGSTGPR